MWERTNFARVRNATGTVGLAIAAVVGFVGGPDVCSLAQNAINCQNFSKSLNVALVPVSIRGNLSSMRSAEARNLQD